MSLTEKERRKATDKIIKYTNAIRRISAIGSLQEIKTRERRSFIMLDLTAKIKEQAAILSDRVIVGGKVHDITLSEVEKKRIKKN